MRQFKRILTTTDLSKPSWSAVQFAAHLAKQAGAKLTVLHVQQTMAIAYSHWTGEIAAELDRAILQQVREEAEGWVSRHIKNQDVEVLVRSGSVEESILRVAQEIDADLIVMATHGHTGLKHLMMGSVTEHVMRNATCPMMVVNPAKMEEARNAKSKKDKEKAA